MAPELRTSLARVFCQGTAALLLAMFAASAQAQASLLYVCTSATGHTISGDRPPPECKDREVRVLNPDGTVKQVISAPLTKEQRRAREEAEEARLRQEEAERAQARKDRALLETYGSADEIEASRARSLAARQVLVERSEQRIAQLQRERKRLDDEAEFYAKREMPPKLKGQFESNAALLKAQENARADALQEIQRLNERYDAEAKRYRELEALAARAAAAREREGGAQPY